MAILCQIVLTCARHEAPFGQLNVRLQGICWASCTRCTAAAALERHRRAADDRFGRERTLAVVTVALTKAAAVAAVEQRRGRAGLGAGRLGSRCGLQAAQMLGRCHIDHTDAFRYGGLDRRCLGRHQRQRRGLRAAHAMARAQTCL